MSEPIIYPITLDLRRNIHQVLIMKEDDANSRVIRAKITDNGKLYNISSSTISIKWHKPDAHIVYNIAYSTIDNNTVEVICTEQMLAVSGIAYAEFIFTDTDNIVSTMKFNVSIEKSVVNNNLIESTDEFGMLNELISENKKLSTDMQSLETQIENTLDDANQLISNINELETTITANEQERVASENTRKTNENKRKTNETARQNNEKDRQTNTSTAISNAEIATERANIAAKACEDIVAGSEFISINEKGKADGVATLGENGKLNDSQLPDVYIVSETEPLSRNVNRFWLQPY